MLRGLSLCGSHWVGTKSLTEGRNISQSHSNYSTPYEKVRGVQEGRQGRKGRGGKGEEERGQGEERVRKIGVKGGERMWYSCLDMLYWFIRCK